MRLILRLHLQRVVFAASWVLALALLFGHGTPASAQPSAALQCFKIKDPLKIAGVVDLDSPLYGLSPGCRLGRAKQYCVPATRDIQSATANGSPLSFLGITGPQAGDQVCYRIKCKAPAGGTQEVSDVFGNRVVKRGRARTLCVPAVPGPPGTGGSVLPMCSLSDDLPTPSEFVPTCLSGGGPESGTIRNSVDIGAPTLRIFGSYGSAAVPGGTSANTVHIAKEENVVLVLSAYDETNWIVTAAPGATIQQIVVVGYEQQYITAPAGTSVDNLSPYLVAISAGFEIPGGGDLIIPDEWPSTDADDFISAAEAYAGLCLTSYHYCSGGGEFVVPVY